MENISKGMETLLRLAGHGRHDQSLTFSDLIPRRWYLKSNSDGTWTAKKLGGDVSFTDKNKHDAAALAWLHESKPVSI
jgi:hypothetical protein